MGILITNPTYADPKVVDAGMPCFRLGAFGTEGMQTKRLKGLFSFLTRDDNQCGLVGVDLVAHAASQLQESDDITALAAQVPSDAPHLLRFSWPEMSGDISEVEFRLIPRGAQVLLQLTHSKLIKRTDLIGTASGWHTHLDVLDVSHAVFTEMSRTESGTGRFENPSGVLYINGVLLNNATQFQGTVSGELCTDRGDDD